MLATLSAARADTLRELPVEGPSFARMPGLAVGLQTVSVTLETVAMRYRLVNAGRDEVEVNAVLRLPSLDLGDPDTTYALPSADPVNILGAAITVDDRPVPLAFRQSAAFEGHDVTKRLREARLPLLPSAALGSGLSAVPPETLLKLVADGLLRPNGTAADGTQNLVPAWTVRTVATLRPRIEPGRALDLAFTAHTSVGASQDTVLRKALREAAGLGTAADQVRKDYCVDDAFLRGVDRLAGAAADNAAGLQERRIALRLTPDTGEEPAAGAFHLTIDKGAPDRLVSTCLADLRKTGPTIFALDTSDVPPPHLLRILIVGRF